MHDIDTGSERVFRLKLTQSESRIVQRVISNDHRNSGNSCNDFVEQQNLIEDINRDGLSFSYPGFSEQVPAPSMSAAQM